MSLMTLLGLTDDASPAAAADDDTECNESQPPDTRPSIHPFMHVRHSVSVLCRRIPRLQGLGECEPASRLATAGAAVSRAWVPDSRLAS